MRLFFKKSLFYFTSRERRKRGEEREEREKETLMWERNTNQLPHSNQGSSPQPGMCTDWELNWQPLGYGTVIQPTEPLQPQCHLRLLKYLSAHVKNIHRLPSLLQLIRIKYKLISLAFKALSNMATSYISSCSPLLIIPLWQLFFSAKINHMIPWRLFAPSCTYLTSNATFSILTLVLAPSSKPL